MPSRGRLWVFPCHMPSGIVACCAEVCRSPSFLTSRCCLSLLENDPGDAHYIDLTRGLVPSKHCNWCPSVKISCLRDFWCHLLLFRLLLLLLFVTEKRTHSQQIKKSNFRILNCTFTPLSWLWMFYWTRQQKIQKPLFVSFSTADFFGRYGSCIRQCIFWQVHDGRK